MGDDHADLLSVSDWINSLSLPLEATAAIDLHPKSARAVHVGERGVARVSLQRFAVASSRPGRVNARASPPGLRVLEPTSSCRGVRGAGCRIRRRSVIGLGG